MGLSTMTNTSNTDDHYRDLITVDYDDLIRKIRAEYNRERNKTDELASFHARVIALLTIARDEYYDSLNKNGDD